jgi:hypothetical protein
MSSRKDYIPDTDSGFNAWFRNFCDRIIADPARYEVLPDDLAELQAAYASWQVSYPAHITTQNAARAAAEVKDSDRDKGESVGRRVTKWVQARKSTTDAKREELGITVPDRTRTPLSEQIVQETPPPVIQAKCTASKTVRIDWYPDQTEGQSEALPQGIDGVSIWVAEGGIPTDDSKWRFLAMDTNSPYIHNVANDSVVTLAYKAQWFDRRVRRGPFCGPVKVAVTP